MSSSAEELFFCCEGYLFAIKCKYTKHIYNLQEEI